MKSPYFTLQEMCTSSTATRNRITNTAGDKEASALDNLVDNLLHPLREAYGKPLHINSGYRCQALNKAVGGVPTSQHTKGEAADVACSSPKKLLEVLLASKLPFDQAICYPTFLHLSLKNSGPQRRQVIYK